MLKIKRAEGGVRLPAMKEDVVEMEEASSGRGEVSVMRSREGQVASIPHVIERKFPHHRLPAFLLERHLSLLP